MMVRRIHRQAPAAFPSAAIVAVLLAGCGGGSSSVTPARLPASGKQIPVAFSITVPSSSTSARKRRPAYISSATQSAVVNVTSAGAPTTRTVVTCVASQCAGTVPAAIGLDTFAVSLNDKSDGTGNTLSAGQTTATIIEGQANAVSVTFNGVITSLDVSFDQVSPPVNAAATVALAVKAYDADGKTIIGPGTYDNPIALSNSDVSGATALSATTITAPGDPPPTIAYNGAWIGGETASAIITASVPANAAVTSAKGELVPAPQVVDFRIPTASSNPRDITSGPDGALWFTEGPAGKIGRMTTAGVFSEFSAPGSPFAIASGADGNLYFSDVSMLEEAFDQITPSGTVTRTSIAVQNQMHPLYSMVLGPDHNLWAPDANGNVIAQFTPSGVETAFPIPTQSALGQGIVVGPDGALWFTEYSGGKIGRITTAGSITEYPVTPVTGEPASQPLGITNGPDGALWFIDYGGRAIGRITTAGAITEFANIFVGRANGMSIVTGPDGAIYFGIGYAELGRITPKGTMQTFRIPSFVQTGSELSKLIIGPDGNIWYADANGNSIGKIVF
jgi:virginiamycin B lyase